MIHNILIHSKTLNTVNANMVSSLLSMMTSKTFFITTESSMTTYTANGVLTTRTVSFNSLLERCMLHKLYEGNEMMIQVLTYSGMSPPLFTSFSYAHVTRRWDTVFTKHIMTPKIGSWETGLSWRTHTLPFHSVTEGTATMLHAAHCFWGAYFHNCGRHTLLQHPFQYGAYWW